MKCIGFEIQIGSQQVECGDIIVADSDGVVVVPFNKIDETISEIKRIQKLEDELDKKVNNGLKISPYIDELLPSERVEFCE